MIEKISKVSNPLTIVGIFAGLAEVAGTVALALISKDLQGVFIWFVILFPSSLVLIFFATLNFNPKVLYAPADFRTDDSFIAFNKEIKDIEKALVPPEGSVIKEGESISIDSQTRFINRLHPRVVSYLIKVAGKPLTIRDHVNILREIYGVSGESSQTYSTIAGLFVGILHCLGGNILSYARTAENIYELSIQEATLNLLKKR